MKHKEVNWQNPYTAKGKLWLKGNLHTHTNKSGCGKIPPNEVPPRYEKMGYSFLAITDHGQISNPLDYQSQLVLLSGIEVDFQGARHTGLVNICQADIDYKREYSQQELIDRNIHRGGIVILNHPNWQPKEHYPLEELMQLKHYTGIEIYNVVIERLDGPALATDKWDRLLSAGYKVLGFANQDSHIPEDYLDCCNVVRANSTKPRNIMHALLTGNFYCYYGVKILDLGRRRNYIYIKTANARLIRFIGHGGRILKKVKGRSGEIEFLNDPACQYIRVECLGVGEQISWTQPFFR